MLDIGTYKRLSVEEYEKFIKDGNFTDLELAAVFYMHKGIPEFREAFAKEYELRNNKPFDKEAVHRILDTIKDDHIASAIIFDKDLDKALEYRNEYEELG